MISIVELFHAATVMDAGNCGRNAATAFLHDPRFVGALSDFEALSEKAQAHVIEQADLQSYADMLAYRNGIEAVDGFANVPAVCLFELKGTQYFGVSDGENAFATGQRGMVKLKPSLVIRSYVAD